MTTGIPALDALNAAPLDEACARLDGLYEHSPWIVRSALARRPFATPAALVAACADVVARADVQAQLAESHEVPPVPSTAIFSRHDGVVAWQNSREPKAPQTDNIEVKGSHCGLGVNPTVLWAIADRLALPEGEWTPFERGGLKSLIYPSSGH